MMYLVDIDGTIADLSHRLHFIAQKPTDWAGFFAACPNDKPIPEVILTINLLRAAGAFIVFVTGRSSEVWEQTDAWLKEHVGFSSPVYMRKAGDHRQDNIVKGELLDLILETYGDNIAGVFDDRKQVVDMYRSRGLRVFQVADGNF